jgi:hypothetical protein
MGKSLVPQLSENIEQRIRIAQDRPEEGPGAIDPWESIGLLATGAPAAPYQFRDVGPVEAGLTLGTSDLAMQMAQPANLAFIAMIPLVFQVPALAMLAQVGITASVLIHAIQKSPEIIELWKTGQVEQAVRLTTNVALELPIAYFAGRGAARKFKGGLYDPIQTVRRQRRMPAEVQEPIEVDLRGRPGEPRVIPPEGAIDITARDVTRTTQRPTEPPGAPQVEPQVTREPGLRPRPTDRIVPEDSLRMLDADSGTRIPLVPRRTPAEITEQEDIFIERELEWAKGRAAEEQAAAAEAVVEAETPKKAGEGSLAELAKELREAREKLYKTAEEGRVKIEGEAAAITKESDAQAYVNDLDENPNTPPGVAAYAQTYLDWAKKGFDRGAPTWGDRPGLRPAMDVIQDINKILQIAAFKPKPGEPTPPRKEPMVDVDITQDVFTVESIPDGLFGVFMQRGGKGPRESIGQFRDKAEAEAYAAQERAVEPVTDPSKFVGDTTIPLKEKPKADQPVVVGQVLLVPNKGYGRITDLVGTQVRVEFDSGDTSLVPADNAIMFRKAAEGRAEEFPERVGITEEPTVTPEAPLPGATVAPKGTGKIKGLTAESLSTGDTVFFKGKRKATVIGKTADGRKALIQWDDGAGERHVLISNLTLAAKAGPPKPEPKVGLRAGEKQNIEIGKGRGGVPRSIQIERDTKGNITATVMATGEPTGTGSKWIEIAGGKVSVLREKVFIDAKRAFIRDRLTATKKGVGSTTEFEQNRSVFWNEESDLILKLDASPDPVRDEIVATETIEAGDLKVGPTYEYAIRPDLVAGKLGWVPVMRQKGQTWEPAGIGRVPNITAVNYDTAVGRIHDALADRTGAIIKFIDPVAQDLEVDRLQEIEDAATAEELSKATAEKQRKARVEKAQARTEVARTAFKAITPKEAPKFVAAVQHRKVLKPLAENAFTFVKDGIATSSNGEITIMTRTDLADGIYTPFVQGENKAFRSLKVASGVAALAPDPVAAEGKQGRITIDAKSNDLIRIQRILKGVTPGRYALNSFQIERANPSEIRVIATDGHRLLINTIPFEGKIKAGENWLVDGRALELILKEKKGTKIELLLDEDTVSLIGQNIAVSNKRQGTFPSWEAVVPTVATELAISKPALIDIIAKAKIEQIDDEPHPLYFTRTPEGLDVQVNFDTVTKLEEIAQRYGTGSKEYDAQMKIQRDDPKAVLVPQYGSIGVIPFIQRKPGKTKSKSEITVQMPVQPDKIIESDFAYNRKYLEDIIAGIRDETVLLGLTKDVGEKQGVFTGTLETAPITTTYKPPTKKQKSAAVLMADPPKKFSQYIDKRRKADMKFAGKITEPTRYAIDLGHYLDGALAKEPVMPAVLQLDRQGLNIEDQVKKWYDERNQEAKAARGGEGAMVRRLKDVNSDAVRRIGEKVGATQEAIDRALGMNFLDEQHLTEYFAAQRLPNRFKAAAVAKMSALERQRPKRDPAAPQEVVSEAEELTGEERLLLAIKGEKPVPQGLVTKVRQVGQKPEPKVKSEAKQLKLQEEEGDQFFLAAEEAKRMGEGAMAGRTDRPGPPGRKPKEPKVKPMPRGKLTLEEIRDETLTLHAGLVKELGEGAMAGRMDRPGPPGRKPPPPMPPKPPAAPPPPGSPPPEGPGEALADARTMAGGLEPKRKSLMELIKEQPLRVQRLFTSEFQPLKYWQDIIYKEQGLELPQTNIARQFELQAGAHGKARADVIEFDDTVTTLLPKNSRLDFDTYVVLERMRDRFLDNPKVKKVGSWTLEKADRGIRELQGEIGSKNFEIIRAVAHNEYQAVMDRALRLQVSSGRISRERYDLIKKHNPFYGPFKILRLIEEIESLPGTGRNIATTQAYTHAIRGIDEDDVVFESILKLSREMVYQSRILAEKNRKMLALHDLMEMGGESNPFKKADPDRFFQIHYKPAEDILHQLAMQETARTGRQTLEHSLMKVGLAIELADSVGLKLKKRNLITSLGRATIGGVDTRGRVNLMAFTSDVIAHELGHSFDVPLRDQKTGRIITKEKKVFGRDLDIVQRLSTVINLRKGVAFGKQGIYQKELMELVKFTKLGGTPAYRAKATERFAEFVNLYIHDPKQARKLAPQWTDFFEKQILPKQKIKQLVESLGAFFQKADKLPNIMDDIKDMNGLKYIELAIRRAFPEKKPQMGVRFGTKPKKGNEILFYLKDGTRKAMEMPAELARAVRGLHRDEAVMAGNWMRLFSQPLRLGATAYNVRFQLRNLLAADLPRATLLSRYGLRRPDDVHRALTDWTYALYSSFKLNLGTPNKLGMDFLKSGAANSGIQSAISPKTFDPTVEKNWAMKVLDTPGKISQAIEETSKLFGLRRALRHEGMLEIPDLSKIDDMPTEEALELIDYIAVEIRNYSGSPDFLRGGQLVVGPHADNLNFLFMFLRARIQGQASDVTRLTGHTGKSESRAAWIRLTPLFLAVTALALYHRLDANKEDFDKRAKWETDNYFMFERFNEDGTPKMIQNERGEMIRDYYRWPKREITQLVGNFVEAAVNFSYEQDPEAVKDFAITFLENISPVSVSGKDLQERAESVASGLNPLFKVPIEFGLGRDTFRHRKVVPQYIEGVPSRSLSPSQQYTSTTPDIFIKLGQVSGISPLLIEQMVRGATAGLITQFAPRSRPGRPKVLSLPLIGPVLGSFVGSEYLATESDEVLEAALIRQGDRQVNINRKSEQIHEAWIAEDPRPRDMTEFVRLQGGTQVHLTKLRDIIEDKRLGLTYTERLIKQLQIANGERAKYLAEKAAPMPAEERTLYLRDMQQKRILTPPMFLQMNAEIRRLQGDLETEPTVFPEQ